MLRAHDLGKAFAGASGAHRVFRGIELEVAAGEGLVVSGPPGSGKSTLLAVLSGLVRPTRGEVWWGDRCISHLPEHALSRLRARHFGILFQDFRLIRGWTAAENVELALVPIGLAAAERRASSREALESVGLAHRVEHRVNDLSGGEQQRVALARALVKQPAVIFADEPTANVDEATAREVLGALTEARQRGAAVLVASHDPAVWSCKELFSHRGHLEAGALRLSPLGGAPRPTEDEP